MKSLLCMTVYRMYTSILYMYVGRYLPTLNRLLGNIFFTCHNPEISLKITILLCGFAFDLLFSLYFKYAYGLRPKPN